MVAPWFRQAMTPRTQPKQWKRGTGRHTRSADVRFSLTPTQYPLLVMLKWVSITPLGKPVVPEVYCMLTTSWGDNPSCRRRYSSSSTATLMASTSFQEYIPRCFSGPMNSTLRRCGNRSERSRSRGCVLSSGTSSYNVLT